jgi:DNA (cytosine-5)-methyltransferase 1
LPLVPMPRKWVSGPRRWSNLNELALFAGGGGGLLGGLLSGFETVCAVEINAYCQALLVQRQIDGCLPPFPVWDDVRTFNGRPWSGLVDVITAGFPCQPFSVAGNRKGAMDERNMWPETIRIIGEVRPEWCLLENVTGLLSARHGYVGEILRGLAEIGYNAKWCSLSASTVGASHRRERFWLVAHTKGQGLEEFESLNNYINYITQKFQAPERSDCESISDSTSNIRERKTSNVCWQRWPPEPSLDRVVDGVAYRVDRLKAIGNGQVPRVAAAAWHILSQ